jgi:hypothetical protein
MKINRRNEEQGCQIFLVTIYQNGEIYTKTKFTQHYVPTNHTVYQRAVKYSKWPQNIPTFSILRPYKIYPDWDFWLENIPSGNPVSFVGEAADAINIREIDEKI